MDFIEEIPKVGSKSVVLTIVDRFSKYLHFIALDHPYMAISVASTLLEGIVRLHGFSTSIVTNWDPVFTGHVWHNLFKMASMTLRMRMAFHPQTDRQSEVVNKVIAMYFLCVTGDRPRAWVDWPSWAEYCDNTFFHTALHATPFEVVYGRPPPSILPYRWGQHVPKLLMPFFVLVMTSSLKSASGSSRRINSRRNIMTLEIVMWSLRLATRCGCISYIVRRNPWTPMPNTSLFAYQEGQTCLHIGHLVPLERSNFAYVLGSSGVAS